ncbi:MAG: glycerol-3-phosphate dehydrogenase C-terminal domain-containing protein, partial [Devosia sp.]
WTTFRAFGEQAADAALTRLGMTRQVRTEDRKIGGGDSYPTDDTGRAALLAALTRDFGVTSARAAHALNHYGTGARHILEFCRTLSDVPLGAGEYTEAEFRYLIRHEFARSLADLLQRRTSLAITGALSSASITRATAIFAEELGWPGAVAAQREADFRALLAHDHGLTPSILTQRDRTTGSLECA